MAKMESKNAELGKSHAALEGRLERLEQSGLDKPSTSIRDRMTRVFVTAAAILLADQGDWGVADEACAFVVPAGAGLVAASPGEPAGGVAGWPGPGDGGEQRRFISGTVSAIRPGSGGGS